MSGAESPVLPVRRKKTKVKGRRAGAKKAAAPKPSELDATDSSSASSSQSISGKSIIGDYTLGKQLWKGAYGVVYQAIHREKGNTVAIKQLNMVKVSAEVQRTLEMEVNLLKSLKHENIVRYIDNYIIDGQLNIVMEFVETGSLANLLRQYGTFPETLCKSYMRGVLHGLVYLHKEGVVHRDIKGGNILITTSGTVKLADFGVSEKMEVGPDGRKTSSDEAPAGTPYYMAPEVIQFLGAQPVSDIWSVGCTIIELITGEPPYNKLDQFSALYKMVQEGVPIPTGLSEGLTDFLERCFVDDPARRSNAATLLKHAWLAESNLHKSAASPDSAVSTLREHTTQVADAIRVLDEEVRTAGTLTLADRDTLRKKLPPLSAGDSLNSALAVLSAASSSHGEPNAPIPHVNPSVNPSAHPIKVDVAEVDLEAFAEDPDGEECWDDAFEDDADDGFDDGDFGSFDDIEASAGSPTNPSSVAAVENESFDDAFAALNSFVEESEEDAKKRIEFNWRLGILTSCLDGIRKLTNPRFTPTPQMVTAATGDKHPKKMKRCDYLAALISQLVAMYERHPEMLIETVKQNALVPIISLLSLDDLDIRFHVLYLLREIVPRESILIPICMMGAIPVIAECGSHKYPPEYRVLAAQILQMVAVSDKQSLQMYAACGGIPILIDFLHTRDLETDHGVIEVTLQTIKDFFSSALPTMVNRAAFLDVFVTHGLLLKLTALFSNLLHSAEIDGPLTLLTLEVLQIIVRGGIPFQQAVVACDHLLSHLLSLLFQFPDGVVPTVVKTLELLKDLSQGQNEEILQAMSPAIERMLMFILPFVLGGRFDPLVYNPIVHCLFNLCRVNAQRQCILAECGGIEFLKDVVSRRDYGPSREFAGPLLCDMASGTGLSAKRGEDTKLKIHALLHQHDVEPLLFGLLTDHGFHMDALQAISRWTLAQPATLIPYLTAAQNIKLIVEVFPLSHALNGTVSALKLQVEAVISLIQACPEFKKALADESSNFIPTMVRIFQVRKDKLPILRLYSAFLLTEPKYLSILDQANLRQVLRDTTDREESDQSFVRAMLDSLLPVLG